MDDGRQLRCKPTQNRITNKRARCCKAVSSIKMKLVKLELSKRRFLNRCSTVQGRATAILQRPAGPPQPNTPCRLLRTPQPNPASRIAHRRLLLAAGRGHAHILNTPKRVSAGGRLRAAARLRPSTARLSWGWITPSSHPRALAKEGSPSLSYLHASRPHAGARFRDSSRQGGQRAGSYLLGGKV